MSIFSDYTPTDMIKRILKENPSIPNPDEIIKLPDGRFISQGDVEKLILVGEKKRMAMEEVGRYWVKRMGRRGFVTWSTGDDVILTTDGLELVVYCKNLRRTPYETG
jgi:hypothetical protein